MTKPASLLLFPLLAACNPGQAPNQASTRDSAVTKIVADTLRTAGNQREGAAGLQRDDTASVSVARMYLQHAFGDDIRNGLIETSERTFRTTSYDLNNDGSQEIFIALTGPYFCGSGGCAWMLLDKDGKLITKFSVSCLPVNVLASRNASWSDLGVFSKGKLRLLGFDGLRYPSNPSVQPAADTSGTQQPAIRLLGDDDGKPWLRF